jgi:hypothetical protein
VNIDMLQVLAFGTRNIDSIQEHVSQPSGASEGKCGHANKDGDDGNAESLHEGLQNYMIDQL